MRRTTRARSVAIAIVLGTALAPGLARAHIALRSPQARYPESEQKDAPCGRAGGTRTDRVAVFEPGETIVLAWDETVDHASHYRIAFDPDGDDDLGEPVLTGTEWVTAAGVQVLADHVPDRSVPDSTGSRAYTFEVMLPRIECERCTLQLMQMMYGRPDPYYYQCADVALRCATPGCLEPDAGTAIDGGAPADAGSPRDDAGARDAGAARDAASSDASGPDTTAVRGGCAVDRHSPSRGTSTLVWLAIALGGLAWRRRAH